MSDAAANYFVMQSLPVDEQARVRVVTDLERPPWLTGAPLDYEVPVPIEYEIRRGFPGALKPFYDLRYPLMRDDLVEALKAAGVDNLQVFDAVIRDANSGERHTNYRAVNVVGVVAAADMDRSGKSEMSDSDMIDASFESLAVAEGQAAGLLLFRLAESVNAVIAHARVRAVVEPRVPGIEFLDPAEWSG